MVAETGDQSPLSGKLATVAASPSIMNMTAAGLRDSMTTITRTARTGVFATARAMGNPFAASGPAINIAQSSRISKAVRLGSLIRSRHSPTKLRLSPRTTEARWRLGTVTGLFATLAASLYGLENFRNHPEGIVGVLVVAAMLPLWQFDLRALRVFVGDFAEDMGKHVEPRPPFVVGMYDIPRRP